MNKAHVFQHKYTGVQIFIYHRTCEMTARFEFESIVIDDRDWTYIGIKTTTTV